jgi:hypothetical protein
MMRRGFWVLTGAVLGVTGYRRVTRLARFLTVPKATGTRSLPGTRSSSAPRMLPAPSRAPLGRGSSRDGGPRRVAPGGMRTQVARAVAAAGFVRDVRDGMAEYWDLHRGELDPTRQGRTLEGQSDRTPSGERQGRREP